MNQEEFINKVIDGSDNQLLELPVLVALSGGADSVALLRLLMLTGAYCRAAHCNFHLRGEESMRDERFVRDLCQKHDIPLTVKDFDVASYMQEHGGSVEMACRTLRYDWFERERQQQGCGVIAVAHHADDQVETFFLNLLRGTGTKGLSGMRRLSGNIWRPLLDVTHSDIVQFLDELGQDYVNDSTNAANDYRRNRLRNIILPVIYQQFPQAREQILDTMANIADDHEAFSSLVNELIPDPRHIDIGPLRAHPHAGTLLYHRIRHLGFKRQQCDQAIQAIRHEHTGRQFPAGDNLLTINRETLDIDCQPQDHDVEIPIDLTANISSPVSIHIKRGDMPFSPLMCDGKQQVAFNTELLNCQRIVLRHWRKGDRIKPFGLNGTKLVSDLFADNKLNHADKRATWIMEADGQIIWVLGLRAAALYTVTPESQDYIIMTLL